jgi:hypothetical protein
MTLPPMGWRPDPPGALPEYEPCFGLDTPKPRGELWREPWTDLVQQSASCTWHGAACAEYAFTGEKNSPYPGHWHALSQRYPNIAADPNGVMPDEGISVSEIRESFRNSGTCEWKRWAPGTLGFHPLKRPPWHARVESQRHNFEVSVVVATGDALFAALACGFDRGHFPLIALDVDEAFINFTGDGVIGKQSGPRIDGHMIPMWNHAFNEGEGLFGNYWPERMVNGVLVPWGMGNLARISAERIAQARAGFLIHRVLQ